MRSRVVIAVLMLIAFAVPANAQTPDELTQGDVDAALQQRRSAGAELEALTARFEQAASDEEFLRERIAELARSVSELEQVIGVRTVQVKDLVVSRYMAGGPLGAERLFAARSFTDLPVQGEYLRLLNVADVALLRGLAISEKLHVEQQELLDASFLDQQRVVADLIELADELSGALAAADAEYDQVAAAFQRQEEERKRQEVEELRRQVEEELKRQKAERARAEAARKAREAAAAATTTTTTVVVTTTTEAPHATTTTTTLPPPPVTIDGRTCPINAANSFSDTWGAPRSGGRTHKGVDMIAVRNVPVVAIESGTVTRISNSSLGGLSVYLTGASGSRYYYAHLEYISDVITGGTNVSVGDLLGGNGSSGNASDWLPHVHFQYAPAGGDWVNPYPLAKALCG